MVCYCKSTLTAVDAPVRLVITAETERRVSTSVKTLTTSPERVMGMVAVNWLPNWAEAGL